VSIKWTNRKIVYPLFLKETPKFKTMKILYIHQYFKTPQEPGGTRSYWIAKELAKNGHEVIMLSTNSDFEKRVTEITVDGFKVIYIKVPYDNKMSLIKRAKSFFMFMISSTIVAFKISKIDLVIATSTPLTIGFPALMLNLLKRIPYIFEVRDLWPEVPIILGGLKNPLLIKLAKAFEKCIYNNALHIIALSPGMKSGVISTGIQDKKVSMIPNMSKVDEFYPREKDWLLCQNLGLNIGSFKIIHFGSLGLANGADSVIDSAIMLKEVKDVEFVFLGGGSTEEHLKERCIAHNLTNVHFIGKHSMKVTSEIVNLADVSIVSFLDLPILYTNSPNKLFDSLSAGKPIIVNSAGWTKKLVEEHQCGFYVNPNNPKELVDKILFLKNNLSIMLRMGEASRQIAETKYDKKILCKEYLDLVENLKVI
jgi:glycosyltransferase involved in cell wall biosynthesis